MNDSAIHDLNVAEEPSVDPRDILLQEMFSTVDLALEVLRESEGQVGDLQEMLADYCDIPSPGATLAEWADRALLKAHCMSCADGHQIGFARGVLAGKKKLAMQTLAILMVAVILVSIGAPVVAHFLR